MAEITDFSDTQIERYARHLVLPEVGEDGQARLLAARVLVVGAGGLGSPLLLYLAAAGVGRISVVDDDVVDVSNLQRQVIHTTERVGRTKAASAEAAIRALNPDVSVVRHETRITADNALDLIRDHDLVADGSDNFATRFLLNDACILARRPLVSAAVTRFDGQLSTYKPHEGGPCYRCIFGDIPPAPVERACSEVGILGSVAGVMGTLQATEVIREIVDFGQGLAGSLLIYDALSAEFRRIRVRPDPGCPACGPGATLRDLSAHKG